MIGDPRAEGVTMGALASLEQLADVRATVQAMVDAGGVLAYGSVNASAVTRTDGSVGVVERGAFIAPLLLTWADPDAPAVHSLEAFGRCPLSSGMTPSRIHPSGRPGFGLPGGHGGYQ